MGETTHDIPPLLLWENVVTSDRRGGFIVPPEFVPAIKEWLQKMDEETVVVNEDNFPLGWLCPRCGAINAPDVKRCECEPGVEDNRHFTLGPSETK